MEQRIRCKRYLRNPAQVSRTVLSPSLADTALNHMHVHLLGNTQDGQQASDQVSVQALSEDEIDGDLRDVSLCSASATSPAYAASVATQDSDSDDLESWSVCSPQVPAL